MWELFNRNEANFYLIAAIEEDVYCPVSYVRVVNHLQLAPAGWQSSLFVLPRDAEAAMRELPRSSGLLLARAATPEAAKLASRARELGLPVIYDIDDYLWKLPDYLEAKDLGGGVSGVLSHATLVTTPSEALGAFVNTMFPELPVRIVPNSADIFYGRPARRELSAVLANSDFFRLPNMKKEFFEAVRDGARAANTRLWLYYLSNDPPETTSDDPNLQIIWCGVRSYSSYRALLNRFRPEIAFVPLPEDHFSRYKSVIKFAEFGRHSIAGIYSRVEPYRSYVHEGRDGWLADNSSKSWREAVTCVLSMNAFELDRVRNSAAARSRKQFRGDSIRPKLFSILTQAGLKSVPKIEPVQPPPPEVEFTFREAYDYVVGHRAALMEERDRLLKSRNDSPPPSEAHSFFLNAFQHQSFFVEMTGPSKRDELWDFAEGCFGQLFGRESCFCVADSSADRVCVRLISPSAPVAMEWRVSRGEQGFMVSDRIQAYAGVPGYLRSQQEFLSWAFQLF